MVCIKLLPIKNVVKRSRATYAGIYPGTYQGAGICVPTALAHRKKKKHATIVDLFNSI